MGSNELLQLDPAISDTTMDDFIPINVDKLLEIVKELNESKSSGIPDISSSLVYDAIFAIPEVFVKVINLSLKTRHFPDDWKMARIAVIPE